MMRICVHKNLKSIGEAYLDRLRQLSKRTFIVHSSQHEIHTETHLQLRIRRILSTFQHLAQCFYNVILYLFQGGNNNHGGNQGYGHVSSFYIFIKIRMFFSFVTPITVVQYYMSRAAITITTIIMVAVAITGEIRAMDMDK